MATGKTLAATDGPNSGTGVKIGSKRQTAEDHAALETFLLRRRTKPGLPRATVTVTKNTAEIAWDHQDPQMAFVHLANALGTTDGAFIDGVLLQIADVARTGRVASAEELNFALSLIHWDRTTGSDEGPSRRANGRHPQCDYDRRVPFERVETIPQQDSASNMLNKLARTFAAQVEALKKYRSTGGAIHPRSAPNSE